MLCRGTCNTQTNLLSLLLSLCCAEERQTAEELELKARLAQLNVTVAEAHTQVAEASKLSAETEQVAVQANIAAEQARQEAQRIQVGTLDTGRYRYTEWVGR